MDSLKVKADALISEVENNADLDYSTLFKYKVDLLGLNLVVEAALWWYFVKLSLNKCLQFYNFT